MSKTNTTFDELSTDDDLFVVEVVISPFTAVKIVCYYDNAIIGSYRVEANPSFAVCRG